MKPAKCQGLLGWIFGHKFIKMKYDTIYNDGCCYRCGMPMGGWEQQA